MNCYGMCKPNRMLIKLLLFCSGVRWCAVVCVDLELSVVKRLMT